jgi:ATP-dependent DNA ligase
MLATLTDQPFSDPAWVFERKLDGVRCLAFRDRGDVRLMSRNRKPLSAA